MMSEQEIENVIERQKEEVYKDWGLGVTISVPPLFDVDPNIYFFDEFEEEEE